VDTVPHLFAVLEIGAPKTNTRRALTADELETSMLSPASAATTWSLKRFCCVCTPRRPASASEPWRCAQLVLPGGAIIWPVQRVMKRFQNGAEDGVAPYAAALGIAIGPAPVVPAWRRSWRRAR
jgi:hypothetical protein